MRPGGSERGGAKAQIGLRPVQRWSLQGGGRGSFAHRGTGDRTIGWGCIFQVTGLGRQASGTGVLVLVQVRENPEPVPGAEDLSLGPDGRDLRPEN